MQASADGDTEVAGGHAGGTKWASSAGNESPGAKKGTTRSRLPVCASRVRENTKYQIVRSHRRVFASLTSHKTCKRAASRRQTVASQ